LLIGRSVETVAIGLVIIIVVHVVGVGGVVFVIVPVEHALSFLEVVCDIVSSVDGPTRVCSHTCNVVDALLPRTESVGAEAALAWEGSLRHHNALGLIVGAIQSRVNIPEMLQQ
jgi:hypothetical protein